MLGDYEYSKSVPMQHGALSFLRRNILMQGGARFLILDIPLGGPTWPSEGVRNIYKPNGILHIWQKNEKRCCARSGCERLKY